MGRISDSIKLIKRSTCAAACISIIMFSIDLTAGGDFSFIQICRILAGYLVATVLSIVLPNVWSADRKRDIAVLVGGAIIFSLYSAYARYEGIALGVVLLTFILAYVIIILWIWFKKPDKKSGVPASG
jgi:hypothetical protein